MLTHFRDHILSYVLVPLLLLTIGASYYRFMIAYDYLVRYEGDCDPYTSSCFQYCEDDACTEPFYFAWVTRHADTLRKLCGDNDPLSCEAAFTCSENETKCEITYCDAEIDSGACETLTENDLEPSTESIELTEPHTL